MHNAGNSERKRGEAREMRLIPIGFGNFVVGERVLGIVNPDSAPVKRTIAEARERGLLIDGTYGRRTRAVLILDSAHVMLSALQPETVAARFGEGEGERKGESDKKKREGAEWER